jgi:hypothetical protein
MIPQIHAEASVKRWGGCISDYLPIHQFMDSSKAAVSDNRHRFLTHNSWFLVNVLPKVFGEIIIENGIPVRTEMITNSDGKRVPVKDIGEWHCMEDFRGIVPTPQDYAEHMEIAGWMNNGKGRPNRFNKKTELNQTIKD